MIFRFCSRLDNCRTGLALAFEHLGIPRIISPEHLSSDDMDELSGMTYMSYFMTGECTFRNNFVACRTQWNNRNVPEANC